MSKSNFSAVINEYCELNEAMKAQKKRMDELRKLILAQASVTKPLKTKDWCITYTVTQAETLDVKLIREAMDAAWIRQFTSISERETLKVTKL